MKSSEALGFRLSHIFYQYTNIGAIVDLRVPIKGTPTGKLCRGALNGYPRVVNVIIHVNWCKI
jgi:hypothetical protein